MSIRTRMHQCHRKINQIQKWVNVARNRQFTLDSHIWCRILQVWWTSYSWSSIVRLCILLRIGVNMTARDGHNSNKRLWSFHIYVRLRGRLQLRLVTIESQRGKSKQRCYFHSLQDSAVKIAIVFASSFPFSVNRTYGFTFGECTWHHR